MESELLPVELEFQRQSMQVGTILLSGIAESIVKWIAQNGKSHAFQGYTNLMRFACNRPDPHQSQSWSLILQGLGDEGCAGGVVAAAQQLVGAPTALFHVSHNHACLLKAGSGGKGYVDFFRPVESKFISQQIGIFSAFRAEEHPGGHLVQAMHRKKPIGLVGAKGSHLVQKIGFLGVLEENQPGGLVEGREILGFLNQLNGMHGWLQENGL